MWDELYERIENYLRAHKIQLSDEQFDQVLKTVSAKVDVLVENIIAGTVHHGTIAAGYKEIDCWECDSLELHKEIDDGIWKCMRCGTVKGR
jgi:hypothetical protein